MAWRSIGLWMIAAWAFQSGCETAAERPTVSVSRRSDAGLDAAAPPPELVDATPDAAEIRGDAPEWPEAEREIELPYQGPTVTHLFEVTATPGALDVHLNVDTTSSIRYAIDELQAALRETVIDRLRARVSDVAFGVSRFADFPIEPFGHPGGDGRAPDRPFVLLTPITTYVSRVTAAVATLDKPLDYGGDIPEAGAESLYQIATGAGFTLGRRRLIDPGPGPAAIGGGAAGGVGFRAHALHVVLHVADSPSHTPEEYAESEIPETHSMAQATAALAESGARVVSILPTPCESDTCRANYPYQPTRRELSDLAIASGAVGAAVSGKCATGFDKERLPQHRGTCPLVFDARIDGSGLSRTLSDAVIALLEQVRWTEVHAEPGDDHLGFVRAIEAQAVAQRDGVPAPELRDRLPLPAPDGVAESFVSVDRRNQLGFRVSLRNDRIAPSEVAQRFRLSIRVVGDSVLLEERTLRVVVSPMRTTPAPETSGHVAGGGDEDAGH